MPKLTITYKDWVHCQVNGLDKNDLSKIYKQLQIFNPAARYTPL